MSLLPLALQKNSKLTTATNKVTDFLASKPGKIIVPTIFFTALWLLCSYIFYLRFPNNYLEPNFFGEEGIIFARNIMDHGFIDALLTTFNGYYIWGIYILEGIAFLVNNIFFGGEFANLPRTFALVSYGFLGFIAIMPLLLLRKYLPWQALALSALLILYVPLGGWDYGVLGTFGNMKFALIFVAFILLIYRHYLPNDSKKVYAVDAGLLICAYTNITVYLMMLFSLLKYLPKLKLSKLRYDVVKLVKTDRSAQSLIGLGVLMIPQLIVIKVNGVPNIPGYLDNPFNFDRVIEIFISRAYLYGIASPWYRDINDVISVVALIAFLALAWFYGKKYRAVFAFGILTIFFATFLFVIKRTGVSDFYIGYQDSGPAQFFFAQNWVAGFILALLLVEIIRRTKGWQYQLPLYALLVIGFFIYITPDAGSYGKNNFMEKRVGNIYKVSQEACKSDKDDKIEIIVYPDHAQKFKDIDREDLCTPTVNNYQEPEISLDLEPFENNYLSLGTDAKFTQTFKSPANNLDGVTVYFSTFMKKVKTPYELRLYDESCQHQILATKLDNKKLNDNSYTTIKFPAQADSANKSYCFTIVAKESPFDALAVQLSAPDVYKEGETNLGDNRSNKDIVFMLHYK